MNATAAAALALFLTGSAGPSVDPAMLIVYAVDPVTGSSVTLSAADVYVDFWGSGETYKVQARGNELRIPLSVESACAALTDGCGAAAPEGTRITLHAAGYEDVSSDLFSWRNSPDKGLIVTFPGSRTQTIRPGATSVTTVPFRRPVRRTLRFIDGGGQPVTNAKVTIRATLARTNHCGVPEGPELFTGTSGTRGEVPLPPGRLEFSVSVSKDHYVIEPRQRIDPFTIDGRFDAPESTITLRQRRRRSLQLEFREVDGTPAHVELLGSPAHGCMSPPWLLGTTDAMGRIALKDFYPEEFDWILVQGSGWPPRWQIDPRKLARGRLAVTLPPVK